MGSLGEYLKEIRENKNLSMQSVASQTGLTDSRISRIENNKNKNPSPRVLKALADFYDISVAELYIKANYLSFDDLEICSHMFHGIEKLTDEDKRHIQLQIDYIVSKQSEGV